MDSSFKIPGRPPADGRLVSASEGASFIKEGGAATFMADVIEASQSVPVIVDFWAEWCGPCKQLTPALEKAVQAAKGAVRMVKINVDREQALAAQMRIQSIPAVYAFYKAQPIDGFSGAIPESQVKAFVKRLIEKSGHGSSAALDEVLAQAKVALEKNDPASAVELYTRILGQDPTNTDALAGLIRCYMAVDELDRAQSILESLEDDVLKLPQITACQTALEVARKGKEVAADLTMLQQRCTTSPDDFQSRLDLASALFASSKKEEAINELLALIRRDRNWNDQAARKQLLKFFEALGSSHELTLWGRRQLSAILFS